MRLINVLTLSVTALAISTSAKALVEVSGNIATENGSFSITEDITFNITTTYDSGSFFFLVFDDWVVSDGSQSPSFVNNGAISYQINGGPVQTSGLLALTDNMTGDNGPITANDGFLWIDPFSLTAGDTLTLLAGSWNLFSRLDYNPGVPASFNGNIFLATDTGVLLSPSASTIPEPGTYATLVGLAAAGFAAMRRRRT